MGWGRWQMAGAPNRAPAAHTRLQHTGAHTSLSACPLGMGRPSTPTGRVPVGTLAPRDSALLPRPKRRPFVSQVPEEVRLPASASKG